jgi:hypothetical protein
MRTLLGVSYLVVQFRRSNLYGGLQAVIHNHRKSYLLLLNQSQHASHLMPESLKKISAAVLEDFKKALALQPADFVEKTKAAQTGTFKVIISTSDEDRQGDSIDQSKWNLKNFESNPVVLWAHDYYSLPVGIATKIGVEGGKLVAEGKFAPAELNPFAGQVAKLYEAGFIKTTSVGYMQHEDGSLELLEFSFVPVPANPYALSMREMKALKLNLSELVMKGLQFTAKAESAGDPCTMTDGSAGVLAEDPDNAGQLICVPAEKAEKSADEPQADEPKPETETAQEEKAEEPPIEEADQPKSETEVAEPEQKSGRTISAATRTKIQNVIKCIKDMHDGHGQSTDTVIAALTDLIGPEGNEGEEPAEKQTPKPKVEARSTRQGNDGFDDIMLARRVLQAVDNVVGKGLTRINLKLRENHSDHR